MKKIILSMAAISALAIAAPAAAQYSNNGYQNSGNGYQNNANANGNITDRIAQLRMRLQAGVQSGAITRREAVPIRQQLQLLNRLERQYSVNGIDGRERNDLQQRIRSVRQQLRAADGGNQARWDRYDDEDGYGRNGQYGRNTDDDRDGRWDDDRQGDYRQPAQRGGIAGIFDALTGGGGLRVGQRASGNLYDVPNEYRRQFRDGNGAYYRSDGRQIYQIDARTDTVVRVYPMNR